MMNSKQIDEKRWWAYRREVYVWLIPSLLLLGIALIAASFAIRDKGVLAETLRELGIVLVSVFGVSILYEIFLAERHFQKFGEAMKELIQGGERNAAICARLGIVAIFPTRQDYLLQYDFRNLCSQMHSGCTLRIVGTTLFAVMVRADSILTAIRQGANIQLGMLDKEAPSEVFEQLKHNIKRDELSASLDRFEELKAQLLSDAPSGRLEIRFHKMPLLDTLAEFRTATERFSVWDISFGADATQKRVFMLDPDKQFAQDLHRRYDMIWQRATSMFEYPPKASAAPS